MTLSIKSLSLIFVLKKVHVAVKSCIMTSLFESGPVGRYAEPPMRAMLATNCQGRHLLPGHEFVEAEEAAAMYATKNEASVDLEAEEAAAVYATQGCTIHIHVTPNLYNA